MQMVAVAFALGLMVALVITVYRVWRRRGEERRISSVVAAADLRRKKRWFDDYRRPLTLEQIQYRAVDEVFCVVERTVGGAILPTTATLRVSVETEHRLRPHWSKVGREIATTLERLAKAEGYDWPGTRFELVGDPILGRREVCVDLFYDDYCTVKLPSGASPLTPTRRMRPAADPQRHAKIRRTRREPRAQGVPRAADDPTWKPAGVDAQPEWFLQRVDGLTYRLPFGRAVTLGASRTCDVIVGSDAVSRTHAQLTAGRSGVLVEDLASTNGTFIDGVQVQGQLRLVREGTLRLGPTERMTLVYRIEAGVTP